MDNLKFCRTASYKIVIHRLGPEGHSIYPNLSRLHQYDYGILETGVVWYSPMKRKVLSIDSNTERRP